MLTPRPLPDRLPSLIPLHPEEEALLRGCLACPWDDATFLVYADWLEEYYHTERADFVRFQVAQGGTRSSATDSRIPARAIQARGRGRSQVEQPSPVVGRRSHEAIQQAERGFQGQAL